MSEKDAVAQMPFRPDTFSCADLQLDLDEGTIQRLLALFVDTRLSRCSKERFHLTYEARIAEGDTPAIAMREAIFDSALNEIIIEAVVEAIDKVKLNPDEQLPTV